MKNTEEDIDSKYFYPYEFLKDSAKRNKMIQMNEVLQIHKHPDKILIFIYTTPKVGSTALVSSLRIWGSEKYYIIHLHDDYMLSIITKIQGITIQEVLLFNSFLKKKMYVIDIYRNPIERKISTFFENLDTYHFNNHIESIKKYNINKLFWRFNRIFPHIANEDYFLDKYNVTIPENFNHTDKYIMITQHEITYIKLRLCDVSQWNTILNPILGIHLIMVKDYETSNKPIHKIYQQFLSTYQVPINFLQDIEKNMHLNYFYTETERHNYIDKWKQKMSNNEFVAFTKEEYMIYNEITVQNAYLDHIQVNHYLDEGCYCKICATLRRKVQYQLVENKYKGEKINHIHFTTPTLFHTSKSSNYLTNCKIQKTPLSKIMCIGN